jgi:hypothetical protein
MQGLYLCGAAKVLEKETQGNNSTVLNCGVTVVRF